MVNLIHPHHHQANHLKLLLSNLLLINTVCISYERIFRNFILVFFTDQPVAGNADGFVQTIINDMELLYTPKQQRSYSLNT